MACVLGRLSARCRMEVLDLWFLADWCAQVRPRACDMAGASGQITRAREGRLEILAPRFVGLSEASFFSWCRMEVLDLWFLAAWRAQVRPRACDVAGASGQSTRMCAGLAPRFVGLNEASPSSWKRALPDGGVFGAMLFHSVCGSRCLW